MAGSASPKQPIYHSPSFGGSHSRRSSTRKSFTSSLSGSQIDSPRTLCPRDSDAFSYSPSHLPAWYVPQELWDRFPSKLKATLAAMQHSGAAVLSGFERLEKHTEDPKNGRPSRTTEADEYLVQLDALPPPRIFRTTSNASSVFYSDLGSPALTGTPNSGAVSPSLSGSQSTTPVSPICLTPSDINLFKKRERSRERSFSVPLEPHDAYYAAELSHLRTEALPRLRHSSYKVDTEWYEAKRTGSFSASDITAFETLWAEQKTTINHLNEKVKRLSVAIGLASTGMGWTAP